MKKVLFFVAFAISAVSMQAQAAWHYNVYDAYEKSKEYIHDIKQHSLGNGNPGEHTEVLNNVKWSAAFSPDGDGERLVVHAIESAKQQILVQAYGFSNKAIIKALIDAHRRGVDVRIILDKSNETAKYSGATTVYNAGIPTYIDDKVAIAHNKVMIIDQKSIITGSFNFTTSAQTRNAENVNFIQNVAPMAKWFIENWNWRGKESHKYEPAYRR